jgi:hypothetical protein
MLQISKIFSCRADATESELCDVSRSILFCILISTLCLQHDIPHTASCTIFPIYSALFELSGPRLPPSLISLPKNLKPHSILHNCEQGLIKVERTNNSASQTLEDERLWEETEEHTTYDVLERRGEAFQTDDATTIREIC